MRVLVHCNGGADLGVGHVLRSLALLEEAASSGHDVTFVGAYGSPFLVDQLRAAGAKVRGSAYGGLPGDLQKATDELRPDVVHLDTYDAVELETEAKISNIQDHKFGCRPANLAIDPTFGAEHELDNVGHELFLRGTRYAPLRSLVTARRGKWHLRAEAQRVLVVMGGTDPQGLTPQVLDVLARTGLALEVTAIATQATRAAVHGSDLRGIDVNLIEPVDDLPALALEQDLVISAAGTSVWELCCLGIPTALVCAVDNQSTGYERVVAADAAVALGSTLRGAQADRAARLIQHTLEDPEVRRALSHRAFQIVDGLGAWRVVRAWEQLVQFPPISWPGDGGAKSLDARRATLRDAETLLRWRNDPQTRANSRHPSVVAFEDHANWLAASLENDNRLLLVMNDEQGDVGTVRWDSDGSGVWTVSVTVAPHRRGTGLAGALLAAGERFLSGTAEELVAVDAEVHETNTPSRRLFAAAGYVPDRPADDAGFLWYRKQLVGP